ncbi:MAG: tetratricopeptide repeat protein [Desertifilum sp.]|uniref:Tetratricopeptide repeat protein n=1 Tax=Desertifilum tharense IPPAS B-1220 TaxID=1781255 RepID=A0ACD5GUA6_9CYAN|nr:tetratricopeptide repeat protein [Desertifilum sp.]
MNNNQAEVWCKRGYLLAVLKQYEEALQAYDRALSLESNSPDIWRARGAILAELKRYQEAVSAFNKAMQVQEQSFNLDRKVMQASGANQAI